MKGACKQGNWNRLPDLIDQAMKDTVETYGRPDIIEVNGHIHPYLNMAELKIFSRVSYVVSICQEYNIEAKKKWELAKKNHEENPVVRDGCNDRGDGLRSSFRGV